MYILTDIHLADKYEEGNNTYVIALHETKQLTKGICRGILNLPIIKQSRPEFDNKTGHLITKYNPHTILIYLFVMMVL